MLINVRPSGVRVAVIENDALTEYLAEHKAKKTLVGSIYRGRVARILPGMQAAFVDIGLDRAAFLYAGDILGAQKEEESKVMEPATEEDISSAEIVSEEKTLTPVRPIQELLNEGQSIMVQVAKDPLGSKGARITTQITLPGRFAVYMPTVEHLGISRRIEETSERERLKEIMKDVAAEDAGLIVRTAAEGASKEAISADISYLKLLYEEIKEKYAKSNGVGLVHTELDVELRAVRDLIREDTVSVTVDNIKVKEKVEAFISKFMPHYTGQVIHYDNETPLFDKHEVDLEVSRSLGRKVWLKSGGYIVIDEAEALVVIDINTGSFVGKKDFEETILKTNLEAVKEICAQLRIRNCGGIIIIDFIDMTRPGSREQVLNTLMEELKKDRAKTNVVGMSELGLVEMTRKRVRASLVKTLCEPCSYCDGKGYIKNKMHISHEIFREAEREIASTSGDSIIVHCHPDIASWIYDEESQTLDFLENQLNRRMVIKAEPEYHLEQFDLYIGQLSGP